MCLNCINEICTGNCVLGVYASDISVKELPQQLHTIVTEDDQILETDLTLEQAETRLTTYLNLGEDVYIGDL